MTGAELVPVERDTYALIPLASDLAERLAKTDFVPSGLRGKPEAVMAAMLTGAEVGLPPMMSLAEIAVINGTPSMSAKSMRALVLSKGHEVWFEEKNTTKVTICGSRAGSDRVSKVTWTMDDAKRAGLAGKQGWKNYPRAYLTARATSELCRDIFADVLGGISYTPEEVEDFDEEGQYLDPEGDGDLGDPVPPAGAKRKATRAVTKKAGARKASARRQPPEAPESTAPPAPLPPLPGEDGYDDGPSGSVDDDDEILDAEIIEDDDEAPDASGVIDLQATLEQAGIAPAKFLRQARVIAKDRGLDQPGAVEEITDDGLIRATLDDLGLAAVMSSTEAPPERSEATEARNKKMWALVDEAWPGVSASKQDEQRRGLISVITDGASMSSKTLSGQGWTDLFDALELIAEGAQRLVHLSDDTWALEPPES